MDKEGVRKLELMQAWMSSLRLWGWKIDRSRNDPEVYTLRKNGHKTYVFLNARVSDAWFNDLKHSFECEMKEQQKQINPLAPVSL